jgi:hypothetical protein
MSETFKVFLDAVQSKMTANHQSLRETVTGLDADALNWQPAPEANSICALVSHALDAERFLLTTAIDLAVDRDRESHFRATTTGSAELLALIDTAETQNDGYLARLSEADLAHEVARPGRTHTGAWWVLQAVEHTREHVGHAQLTRQMWEAR